MSSFRKRNLLRPIPGTRTSAQTGQMITSSGNPSLDVIFGGGLPIGSICLIEEDKYVTHAKVLAKYFLAEGIVSGQAVFLGSLDDEPADLLRKLPKPLNDDEVAQEKAEEEKICSGAGADAFEVKNGLRIAWRYDNLPLVNSEQTTAKIGHHFNLMEHIDQQMVDYAEALTWNDASNSENIVVDDEDEVEDHYANSTKANGSNNSTDKDVDMSENKSGTESEQGGSSGGSNETNSIDRPATEAMDVTVDIVQPQVASTNTTISATSTSSTENKKVQIFENSKYLRIFREIHTLLREDKFMIGAIAPKGLCRVCITSLGSPLWYDEAFAKDLLKFLTVLRAAVRGVTAVCFITMPMHLIAKYDESLVHKIRNLVDFAIELESFAGSERETNPAFKEYSGLLHLRKMSAINTLTAYVPETTDLAFKLRRKKFVIEKLHLPPELAESQHADQAVPTLSCSTTIASNSPNPKATLDF